MFCKKTFTTKTRYMLLTDSCVYHRPLPVPRACGCFVHSQELVYYHGLPCIRLQRGLTSSLSMLLLALLPWLINSFLSNYTQLIRNKRWNEWDLWFPVVEWIGLELDGDLLFFFGSGAARSARLSTVRAVRRAIVSSCASLASSFRFKRM